MRDLENIHELIHTQFVNDKSVVYRLMLFMANWWYSDLDDNAKMKVRRFYEMYCGSCLSKDINHAMLLSIYRLSDISDLTTYQQNQMLELVTFWKTPTEIAIIHDMLYTVVIGLVNLKPSVKVGMLWKGFPNEHYKGLDYLYWTALFNWHGLPESAWQFDSYRKALRIPEVGTDVLQMVIKKVHDIGLAEDVLRTIISYYVNVAPLIDLNVNYKLVGVYRGAIRICTQRADKKLQEVMVVHEHLCTTSRTSELDYRFKLWKDGQFSYKDLATALQAIVSNVPIEKADCNQVHCG